jgi:type II secretory pathway pseudopilin PulG
MFNNKGFSLVETALVILIMSATIFAFINVMNVQAQKAALKNYSKDLTNTYQTFLDAFIKYVQKVNPTTSTTYTCTTIKADPDKFLPDSFSCIDNLGQSLEGRVSFKGASVYGYFVYGNPGEANVSNYLNAFDIKTFTQLINLFIQMTGDLDNTSKKFLVIQNKTNIYQINSTNYVTATTSDIFGDDTYLSSLPVFSFAGQQYTIGLWNLYQSSSSGSSGTPTDICDGIKNLPPYTGALPDDASGPANMWSSSQQVCKDYAGYPICCLVNSNDKYGIYYIVGTTAYRYKISYTIPKNTNYSTTFYFSGKIANDIMVAAIGAGGDGDTHLGGGAGGFAVKRCIGLFASITISFVNGEVTVTIPNCATVVAESGRGRLGGRATGGDLNYTGAQGDSGGGGIAGGNSTNGNGGGAFASATSDKGGGINGGYAGTLSNRQGENGGYGGGGGRGYSIPARDRGGNGGWGGGGGTHEGSGGVGGGGGAVRGNGGPAQVTILYNVQ